MSVQIPCHHLHAQTTSKAKKQQGGTFLCLALSSLDTWRQMGCIKCRTAWCVKAFLLQIWNVECKIVTHVEQIITRMILCLELLPVYRTMCNGVGLGRATGSGTWHRHRAGGGTWHRHRAGGGTRL